MTNVHRVVTVKRIIRKLIAFIVPNFLPVQVFAQVEGRRQVVGMGVGFQNPLHGQRLEWIATGAALLCRTLWRYWPGFD